MLFDLNKQINVLMFGKHSEATGYWHNGRSLTAHFLMYCIEGSLSMQVEDNTYYIEAGNSFFIPKNTFYKPLRSDGCIYYFIHFIANSPDSDNLHPDPHVNINVLDSDDDYSYNLYGEENGISIKQRF